MTDVNNTIVSKVIDAWKMAEVDLNIKIEVPYFLTNEDGQVINHTLLVRDFGSKLGTLIFSTTEMFGFDTAKRYGYYCSALNFDEYSNYNRELFIDTLNDWGYFGDNLKRPDWCNDKPWTG
jgi:hypothetical protein